MFKYCDKCIEKHKGKTCECLYPEVKHFIKLINKQDDKQFELIECPDENNKNPYSVDLHYKDYVFQEDLWIEVKEVILSMTDSFTKAKNGGQELIEMSVNNVLNNMTTSECSMIGDYYITIPYEKFGNKDIENFEKLVYQWLQDIIHDKFVNILRFQRTNGKVINLSIEKKSSDMIQFGNNLLIAKEVQPFNNIGENMNACSDIELIGDLICDNILKTEETKNKFPNNERHRILLNILRLPYGMDIFWNISFAKGLEHVLISCFENSNISGITNITESYFVFFMENYHTNTEKTVYSKPKQVLICYPIIKGIVDRCLNVEIIQN